MPTASTLKPTPTPWWTKSTLFLPPGSPVAFASASPTPNTRQRIVDVWNEYVREIGVSDEALVTAAELHNLRDAHFAVAQLFWSRGQSLWAVPSIYAVDSGGQLADGFRAIETLRILYDREMMFDNLRAARERVRKRVLVSEELQRRLENAPLQQKTSSHVEGRVYDNPVWLAETSLC